MDFIHGWTHQVLCLMEVHGLILQTLARGDSKSKDHIACHVYVT